MIDRLNPNLRDDLAVEIVRREPHLDVGFVRSMIEVAGYSSRRSFVSGLSFVLFPPERQTP